MASVQARREKVTDEGGILVEKDTVPKMATHYETLAGKARADQLHVPFHGEKDVGPGIQVSGTGEKGVAAGFVGKVKDQAAVVGWGTAQYTLEKVAETTKAAADITASVAGYTGEKVVVAKDKVGGAGKTVVKFAGEKIAATTDAVVAAEEKAAEYAAKKQAEAIREVEAIRASHSHEIVEEESNEQREATPEKLMGGTEEEEQSGSILGAIGETILEIGQTTKAFLLALSPIQNKDEEEFTKEP